MTKRDYYDILGVAKNADEAALKKAYRKLAMECHPDRNHGNPEAEHKFKELSEAYDVLKDPQKRAAYDQFGHAAFEHGRGGHGGGFGGGFDGFAGGFADIFESVFSDMMGGGGGRRQQNSGRGSDLRFDMDITLEESFSGATRTIKVPTTIACEPCHGSGAKVGTQPVTCNTCGGTGKVRARQAFFMMEHTCPTCHGSGQTIKEPCPSCHGQGRKRHTKELQVNIPAGVEDGTRIRLGGEGEAGVRGAPSGDLYIFLSVKPHSLFQRDGAHLHCRVPLPMCTAALGGSIEVPVIDGTRATVTIPAGTQNGHQFRLKGKGMSVLRSHQRGDLYIEVSVETPVHLTKRQKELLEEFSREGEAAKNQPQATSFFDQVQKLWEDLKDTARDS
ncbi:MAG: molecular chaperone DnaJ [Pseudomonadota bacterium]|nr:molecular chaperone DnaJ [Pseudomonadota bacterium]